MRLTLSKIQSLEKKTQEFLKKRGLDETSKLEIPVVWEDFARMTSVRSAGEIVKFDPYPYQIELVNLVEKRSVCVVKSRQLGISETVCSYMLWRACLNPGYLGVVFSKNQVDTSLLARRMKRMIESIGLQTATENLGDIEILGKGRILFKNSKPDSGRGLESVVDVYLDEFAFQTYGKEILDTISPAQSMVGDKARVIIVSTPNGKAGCFYDLLSNGNGEVDIADLCEKASNGETEPFQYWTDSGDWGKVLIHWRAHPIYGSNQNFLEDIHEKKKLSWQVIQQEYNLSFHESETNFYSADIVKLNATGELSEPQPKTFYFVGVDTSTTGDDYSVCVVYKFDMDSSVFSLVHLYRKRQQTSQYHLFHIGEIIEMYNPTAIAVEVTGGTGQVYLEHLSQSHPHQRFHSIRTTGDSKPAMLDRIKLLLEQNKFRYPHSNQIVDELLNFKRNGLKLEAARGKTDDIIMASCFALAGASIEEYI